MKKEPIDKHMTWIKRDIDKPFLKTHLLPVNEHLFISSEKYREVVLRCCQHLKDVAMMEFEDYPAPRGISGANVGIPFNIVGLVMNRNLSSKYVKIFINPVIERTDILKFGKRMVSTNCGSIRLERPVQISRHDAILISWLDEEGIGRRQWWKNEDAYTLQHEIDHNHGILITDRFLEGKYTPPGTHTNLAIVNKDTGEVLVDLEPENVCDISDALSCVGKMHVQHPYIKLDGLWTKWVAECYHDTRSKMLKLVKEHVATFDY